MTARDRIVLMVVCTLVLPIGLWFFVVAPERQKASSLDAKISAANTQLSTAESELASARGGQARYSAAYASIVSLGKAVPPTQEVPSLVYQLDQASNQKSVEFSSVISSGANASGTSGSAGSGAVTPVVAPTVFTQMPFTFVFNGGFVELDHLFGQLNRFTERTPSGVLQISGRLLTVQGVKLDQKPTSSESHRSELSGTITATAYVLPASQGLTAGATPAGPAGAAAGSSSASSPTTPAIAQVTR
jgi:Tfp pilus assembly protein PilO